LALFVHLFAARGSQLLHLQEVETSSTSPWKLVKGPSTIRTLSPRSNVYFGFGFSIDSLTWTKI